MMNRFGLDRFKKATGAEPFSVTQRVAASIPVEHNLQQQFQVPARGADAPQAAAAAAAATPPVSTTAFGAGGCTWQPPDWAGDPKSGAYWLDVMKEGEVVDKIPLERRRLIFGRQHLMCDLVLDHPSVSRTHAALVHHKNGGIYGIDLGSVHGTFVANERLTKDNPVELEVGQTLRFAASTRIYVLRKSIPTPVVPVPPPVDFVIPPPPDASDEEALLAYNTSLNKLGVPSSSTQVLGTSNTLRKSGVEGKEWSAERPSKKAKKGGKVSFRDEYGGILAEVVGFSDGADVSTEPGPVGVREGNLVAKYESLVQVTVIPKGQEDVSRKAEAGASPAVTQRLKQYLDKVKSPGKGGGLYGDIYGESLAGLAGGSWASSPSGAENARQEEEATGATIEASREKQVNGLEASKSEVVENPTIAEQAKHDVNFNDDDLFGEDEDT